MSNSISDQNNFQFFNFPHLKKDRKGLKMHVRLMKLFNHGGYMDSEASVRDKAKIMLHHKQEFKCPKSKNKGTTVM